MISKKLNSSDVDWGENNSTITNKSVKNLVNQTKQRKKTTIPSSLKKKKKKGLRREGNTYTKNKLQRVTTTTTTQFVYVYFPKRSQSININIDWLIVSKSNRKHCASNKPAEWVTDDEILRWGSKTCTQSGDSQQVIQFHRRARWQMVVIRQIVVWVASP